MQQQKLTQEQEKILKQKRKKELKLKRDRMQKKEKQALWLSLTAGIVFAVVEFLFAIFTHSQSVLMDSVYDTSELIFIVLILYLTPLFYKPISESHPYGYFQLESIFLIVKGFMMISVTFGVGTVRRQPGRRGADLSFSAGTGPCQYGDLLHHEMDEQGSVISNGGHGTAGVAAGYLVQCRPVTGVLCIHLPE